MKGNYESKGNLWVIAIIIINMVHLSLPMSLLGIA